MAMQTDTEKLADLMTDKTPSREQCAVGHAAGVSPTKAKPEEREVPFVVVQESHSIGYETRATEYTMEQLRDTFSPGDLVTALLDKIDALLAEREGLKMTASNLGWQLDTAHADIDELRQKIATLTSANEALKKESEDRFVAITNAINAGAELEAELSALKLREERGRELLRGTSERIATLADPDKARAHDAVTAELMLSRVHIDAHLASGGGGEK